MRTTKKDVNEALMRLRRRLPGGGNEPTFSPISNYRPTVGPTDLSMDRANGGYKLESNGESKALSPRLSASEMVLYLNAMATALDEWGRP